MQAVKETVQCICNILTFFGLKGVDANHFRLAKHNSPDALKPISTMLHDLLILDLFDFEYKLSEISNNHIDQDGLEIVLLYMKNCHFIVYKNGKPGLNYGSSRDLLLIIGQLLAEADIFDKFRAMIAKKVLNLQTNLQNTSKKPETHTYTLQFTSEGNQILDFENLNRMIKHQFTQIGNLLKRKEHCISIIDKMILNLNVKDVNTDLLLSLQDPDELNRILQSIKDIVVFLELETAMHRHQEVFWAWLESIVEEDKKDVRDHIDYGFPDENLIFPQGVQMMQLIEIKTTKLNKLRQTFEIFDQVAQQFESEWEKVSKLIQQDPNSAVKLQQLQQQIHKIMAQNTIKFVNLKTFREQQYQDKELVFCQYNDYVKYELRTLMQNQQPKEHQQNATNLKEELVDKMNHLQQTLEVSTQNMKLQLRDLKFLPS